MPHTKIVEKIKTHFMLHHFLHMRFVRLTTNAAATLSEYVIVIAFARQQWLRERTSILSFTYIA
jgi:hypothetical protein